MTGQFTGLVPETASQRADRLWQQISLPPCAGREVKETLWAEPPPWNRIENQQQTNMCAAHAGTTAVEVVAFQATKQMVQRSRLWTYFQAQKRCGIYGDRGVTLGSVIQAGQEVGVCREDLWPFKGYVESRPTAECAADALQCKITATIDIHTGGYRSVRTLVGQNMGAVLMATEWPLAYDQGYIVEHYRPQGNGGHARCWMALAAKLDSQGRPYVWCANSHSTMAEHQGYELWSPTAIDEHLRGDQWGSTGITALTTVEPQEIDWTGVLNPFLK